MLEEKVIWDKSSEEVSVGDYGKHIVNASISTGMMLAAYEKYPDNGMNIPEGGNGVPDILGEMRYEIDQILTMQDDVG